MFLRVCVICFVFFFKQKTAYEMRISDWSSDVCSSDLGFGEDAARQWFGLARLLRDDPRGMEAPRARDDLIVAVLTIGTHQQRLDDAALAHGWQHIGHVRCPFPVAHVGLADGQLVLIDENECHGTTPCECRSVVLSGRSDRFSDWRRSAPPASHPPSGSPERLGSSAYAPLWAARRSLVLAHRIHHARPPVSVPTDNGTVHPKHA